MLQPGSTTLGAVEALDSEPDARADRAPLRVVALIDTAIVSGPGRQLAALATASQPHGIDLHVLMFQRSGRPPSPFIEHLRERGIPHVVLDEDGPADLRLVGRVRRALLQLRPDIVQTHGYRPATLVSLLRTLGLNVPWIAFFHGDTSENAKVRLYHALERRLVRRADRLVVMSRVQRESFAHLGERVEIIHNAVIAPPASVSPSAARAADVLPETPVRPVLGVVGRLSPEKGVDVFLRSAALLREREFAFSAVVAGDGPERIPLEALSAELGLSQHVRFLGTVTSPEMVYAQIDLLVIPSRSEGLPNVLLEALRADRHVVSTRVGAVPEVLEGTDAGVMVPPDSPSALADGIVRALAASSTEGAATVRREVVARFSLERRVEAHRALYTRVLGQARRHAS